MLQPHHMSRRATITSTSLQIFEPLVPPHAMAALLQRCSPRLVLGEQVEGLLTCYPLARAALLIIMQPLPYVWFWRSIDAWDRGAPSHRRRIGIVACRCDCLRLRVARAAAGAAGRCDCGRAVKGWCRRCEAE